MNTVNNNSGNSGIPAPRSDPRSDRRSDMDGRAGRTEAATPASGSATQGPPRSRSESVSLTQTAAQLLQFEQELRELPSVDQARVESVRQAIADGSYKVDPEAIADSLLRSDRERS